MLIVLLSSTTAESFVRDRVLSFVVVEAELLFASEVVLAFEYRGSSEDIGVTVHAHPTLSEVTKEAALATLGRALHI